MAFACKIEHPRKAPEEMLVASKDPVVSIWEPIQKYTSIASS
jgi:hypothetical protein